MQTDVSGEVADIVDRLCIILKQLDLMGYPLAAVHVNSALRALLDGADEDRLSRGPVEADSAA